MQKNRMWHVVYDTGDLHLPIPPKVLENHKNFLENSEYIYECGSIGDYYKISYEEVLNAISFLKPDAVYSMDHGVKGEEYNNVLWAIGRGWNNYQFDKFMGCNSNLLKAKDYDAYIRNRNLFYVCCSRPRKRLVLFITVKVENDFLFWEYTSKNIIFGDISILCREYKMSTEIMIAKILWIKSSKNGVVL